MNWTEVRNSDWRAVQHDGLEAVHAEVRRGLGAIGLGVAEPREIRILKKNRALSGVFDDTSIAAEQVCQEAAYQDTIGCYVTLNPSRIPVTNQLGSGKATSDEDVTRRTRLVIDVDAIRQGSKQTAPATNPERQRAVERGMEMIPWLRGEGWPEPGWMETPNGVQLWNRIDLPVEDDGVVQGVLLFLQQVWPENGFAKIDTTLFNPSRIARIPATPGRKGEENSSLRPWRCGGIWQGPSMQESAILDTGILMGFAAYVDRRGSYNPGAYSATPASSDEVNKALFWLVDWLRKYRVPNVGPFRDWKDGGKLAELSTCPWEPEHGQSYRPFVGVYPNGKLMAGCHGERCECRTWHHFRSHYETRSDTGTWRQETN